jgi:dihydropteroate synthase
MVRVHDVAATCDALRVLAAVEGRQAMDDEAIG